MEMNIVKITDANTTGNKKLDTCINRINSEFSKGIKASHNIARELEKIKNEELFTATGANSFSDFCENQFGISKSQASSETVIDENGKTIYTYEAYTTSKLVEMLKATDEQLGLITSDMTVLEIRQLISGKAIEDKNDSDGENDGENTGNSNSKKKNTFDIEALKAKINDAIDVLTYGEIAEKSAYENVLEWIDELI